MAPVIERPSSTYKQHWDYEFFKTLKNENQGELYVKEAAALQDDVRLHLNHLCMENNLMALLQSIDDIQRLGLYFIFKEDIAGVMNFLVENNVRNLVEAEGSLYATALYFRLFRQHGFNVSEDVLAVFKDSNGCFKEQLGQDIKGMLSLFEASYLASEGDEILDEGKAFARRFLSDVRQDTDPDLVDQVSCALGLPLHYNIGRLEARCYMDIYSKRKDANINLLKYAKFDYNMRQGTFREELAIMSRWWDCLGLMEKLPFTRDCLIQAYSSAIGMNDEPPHGYCRQGVTKMLSLMSVIDDVYDSYSTLEEANILTDAFERWDFNQVERLPEYMKLVFLAIYNTINDFAYDTMKIHCVNILPYLRKMLMKNIKAYMTELQWVKSGYVPTLKEYLKVACTSNLVAILYFYSYVFMSHKISTETLDYMASYPGIIHWSSLTVRLVDDLSTYQDERKRGDNVKAIQCYMTDEGVTEEESQAYISNLVEKTWKKLNAELLDHSPLPQATTKLILNTNRVAQVFYRKGDGYGHPDFDMKEKFSTLVLNSVPM